MHKVLTLMRAIFLLTAASLVLAWSKDDHEVCQSHLVKSAHEIFNLNVWLEDYNPILNFYTFLGPDLGPWTPLAELNKAYKTQSLLLHPDKKDGNAEAYASLNSVIAILRRPELRDRYNHFLNNGFPKWRGTAWLYNRFKPGLGFVLFFLTCVISLFQYFSNKIANRRIQERIDHVVRQARAQSNAGSRSSTPQIGSNSIRRRVKISMDDDNSTEGSPSRRQAREMQRQKRVDDRLDVLVEGDEVLIDQNGEWIRLDNGDYLKLHAKRGVLLTTIPRWALKTIQRSIWPDRIPKPAANPTQ